MESPNLMIDQLANKMNWWKGLVLELELIPDEKQAKRTSQTTLVARLSQGK